MSILGIGVDVLHVPRIFSLVQRRGVSRFGSRILSAEEFSEWEALPHNESQRIQYLAVRFSLKEAAYKAFYPVARPTWKELTFQSATRVKIGMRPSLIYHPEPSDSSASQVGRIHASVSHDGEYVFTAVTVEWAT